MFNNLSKIMFFVILMSGTFITISANSWLGIWMGLEINLLSFIPLMSDNTLMSTESSLKYFLTQAMASSSLLFTMIMMLLMSSSKFEYNSFFNIIMFSSLLLKMGAAPFHFWFPNVMEGLSWTNSLILMTWQKIAPMIVISYIMIKPLMMITIMTSAMIGAFMGLNQTSLRKLMAYSSINHLGWMLTAMLNSYNSWMTYFLLYSFMTFLMIYMFNMFKISHMNQLFTLIFMSKSLKFFIMFNLLSLGGLPPFLGFLPKWVIIQQLTMNNQLILLTILVMTTLITLYFYIRLSYSSFMLNYNENFWSMHSIYNLNKMKSFMIFTYISSFSLFLISSLYYLT